MARHAGAAVAMHSEAWASLVLPAAALPLAGWVAFAAVAAPACMVPLALAAVVNQMAQWHTGCRGRAVSLTGSVQDAAYCSGEAFPAAGDLGVEPAVPAAASAVLSSPVAASTTSDDGNSDDPHQDRGDVNPAIVNGATGPFGPADSSSFSVLNIVASQHDDSLVASSTSARPAFRPPALLHPTLSSASSSGTSRGGSGNSIDDGVSGSFPITPAQAPSLPAVPSIEAPLSPPQSPAAPLVEATLSLPRASVEVGSGFGASNEAVTLATSSSGGFQQQPPEQQQTLERRSEYASHRATPQQAVGLSNRARRAVGTGQDQAGPEGTGGLLSTLSWLALGIGPQPK